MVEFARRRHPRSNASDTKQAPRSVDRKPLLPVHKQTQSRIGKNRIDAVYNEAAAAGVTH